MRSRSSLLDQRSSTRNIRVLFIIQLISMGAVEMSGPFWPVHLRSFDVDPAAYGFAIIAVYVGPMFGVMITSVFWGRMGDRFGHRSMMMRALAGLAITQLALSAADDVWAILILRLVQGMCAGYIAPAQAYGVRLIVPAQKGRLFAFLQVATNVGSLGGAFTGGLILDFAAFKWINLSAAVICAACVAGVWFLLPDARDNLYAQTDSGEVPKSPQLVLKNQTFMIVGVMSMMGILLFSRMITQSPFSLYMREVLGAENWIVGLCYGVMALGFVISASFWARYFEDRNLKGILLRLVIVVAACVGVTLVAGLTSSVVIFCISYFIWGLLLAATTPVLMTILSNETTNSKQGSILGTAQSVSQFSAISGIAVGGIFSQMVALDDTYLLVSFMYALAVLLILYIRRALSKQIVLLTTVTDKK